MSSGLCSEIRRTGARGQPAIEARGLHYAYPDGTVALQDLSFTVAPGEAVALVGANGAGKSTLLLQLNGCLEPTRGEVLIGGVRLDARSAPALRRHMGTVFQDPDDQLFMPSVFEDVAFAPLHAGLPADEVERRAREALARVGMAHLRERPPYRLSAGEKRAVSIATALPLSPAVLLLDEPSASLDPRGRRRLIALLRELEPTRIIATHDLGLVLEVCHRVLLLDGGRLVAAGPPRELLADGPLMLAHGLEPEPRPGP